MNKEQLLIVQRTFGAFGWHFVIEIEGEFISIANGLLWISETKLDLPILSKAFKLEKSKFCPGSPGEPDDHDFVGIAVEPAFPDIVVRAVGCYAEYKALAIMDDLAAEAMVAEYDKNT